VGTSSPLPFQQVVRRLWSKGAIVKQINAVQDESAKKLPPQHIMGLGLRKSPPELNAAAVITKSPTNSVAAAASTLIYQKNYVDGNAGNSGGNGGKSELYDDVLEVNSSKSNNSEDSEENECNANGSKEDDSFFIWRRMNLMQQVAQRWMKYLLLKDWFIQMTKRICSRLSQKMKLGPLFPRTLYARILFQVVQQNQM
jgi:hypothetical protein